jgi:hypothetical protein
MSRAAGHAERLGASICTAVRPEMVVTVRSYGDLAQPRPAANMSDRSGR